MRTSRTALLVLAVAAAALLPLSACSKDDSASTTTAKRTTTSSTTTPTSTTAGDGESTTVRFDKDMQLDLNSVGCFAGAVDGILGPRTDAAVVEFQRAKGLAVNGELTPATAEAVKEAASAGTRVCSESSTTTAAPATTTTTARSGTAACTATALLQGLPAEGEQIASFVCSSGWAAGKLTDGTKFILQSQNGQWYAPSQDPCGSASAGLDPVILEDGCPAS